MTTDERWRLLVRRRACSLAVQRARRKVIALHHARSDRSEDGFTLIELTIALALSAIIFSALAATLGGGLKALAVQKTRSHGNEIATQGIEDLQRFDFNNLGFCPSGTDPSPSTVPPSVQGLPTVQLPNCGSASLVYEQPCATTGTQFTTFPVPRQTYICTQNNVAYSVSRFVVWADAAKTAKRLAVYVNWTDAAGNHQVAQESSLRSPNAASVIGVLPPQFISATVTSSNYPVQIESSNGQLDSQVTFNAITNGLTASDKVYVTLNTLTLQQDGSLASVPTQFPLTSVDGSNWTLTLPGIDPLYFGQGSQFVTFTEVRSTTDGKANSRVASNPLKFCPDSGCSGSLPVINSAIVSPTGVNIDAAGVLQSSFTINATTTNVYTEATVTALVQTQTGAASFQLAPSTSCVVGGNCDNWSVTVSPGSTNFRFPPGNQILYVTATQPVSGSGGTNGSSSVLTTNTVTFA